MREIPGGSEPIFPPRMSTHVTSIFIFGSVSGTENLLVLKIFQLCSLSNKEKLLRVGRAS